MDFVTGWYAFLLRTTRRKRFDLNTMELRLVVEVWALERLLATRAASRRNYRYRDLSGNWIYPFKDETHIKRYNYLFGEWKVTKGNDTEIDQLLNKEVEKLTTMQPAPVQESLS